ncbi:MAG: hypothetical protein ACKODX_05535 [Gemmata sp.]
MTNDAKLGMLAGVLGVILAAVFLAKPAQPVAAESQTKQAPAPTASAPVPGAPPQAGPAALPSTPVARTRRDVDATPASRQVAHDEEP